jgi:hypothetical protein
LINSGTLTGAGTILELGGVNNSGTISVASFNFNRAGAQTLLGAGSFSNNLATVVNGSTLTLLNSHQFSSLTIQSGATLNISSLTLSVSGNLTNNGGTFTVTDSTVVANGATPQTLTGANFFSLTANNSGASLGSNTTVTNLLTLTSDLTTGAFVLTMPFATQNTAGGGDLIGNFRLTNPGGSLSKYGNPFTRISVSGGTAPTDITVNLVKSAPVGFPTAVQRTYTITPNGGVGFTATVQLHYLDGELNGNTEGAGLSLWRFGGTTWQKQTTNAFSITDNWVQTTNVTQFSPWTFNSTVPTAAPANISGQITTADGTPLSGVLMTLTDGNLVRRSITNNNGVYQFTEVDTDSFYSVRPLRANYDFAPRERAFSLLGNKTDAIFTAHALPETANPLDTAEFFVRQQYVDILGREPDEGGFNYWSDEILRCGDDATCTNRRRREVAAAFFIEQEFQQSGSFIHELYQGALGRRPLHDEYSADRGRVLGGPNLDEEKTAFAASFAQRTDFLQKYPANVTAESFVDALLQNVHQHSAVDLSYERDHLITLYQGGANQAASRGLVLRAMADNAAFKKGNYNPAFVLTEYFAYLRRDPEPDGYYFWLDVLNNREVDNFRGMVCSFITSTEYQRRFSSIVTHSNAECGR